MASGASGARISFRAAGASGCRPGFRGSPAHRQPGALRHRSAVARRPAGDAYHGQEAPGIAGPRRNGSRASCEVIRSRDLYLAWMNALAVGMSDGPVEP